MTFFGCRHKRLTFPITPKRAIDRVNPQPAGRTYRCCLDCGKEIDFDARLFTGGEKGQADTDAHLTLA